MADPRILVIANDDDARDAARWLAEGGVAGVAVTNGSDAGLAAHTASRLDVAVLFADLATRDPRAAAEALRAGAEGLAGLVVVGQTRGPIRTALDAIDLAADRFLRAPVSPQALVFAVRSLLSTRPTSTAEDPLAERIRGVDEEALVVGRAGTGEVAAAALEARLDEALAAALAERIHEAVAETLAVAVADRDVPAWREATQIVSTQAGDSLRFPDGSTEPVAGGLALEVRRTMTAIEQRLFGEGAGAGDTVSDEGPDIDLSAIEVATGRQALELPLDESPTTLVAMDSPDTTGDGELAGPSTVPGTTGAIGCRTDLADEDTACLIARLHREGLTGRAVFHRAEAEKIVFFDDGRPVFAASNLPHDRMGDLLYREGKITRLQYTSSREVLVESGRRLGEILVELGFLKPRELLPAVRRHVEDLIYSLFAWDVGECDVWPGDGGREERIRLTTHPAALVIEGVRRKMGLARIAERLGGAQTILVPGRRDALTAALADADLATDERQVVGLFDGRRTLAEVVTAARADELTVHQIAYALVALRLVNPRSLDAAPLVDEQKTAVARVTEADDADAHIDRERIVAKHAQVVEADYLTVLGVRREATAFEIRRAYESVRRDYAAAAFSAEVQRDLAGPLGEIAIVVDEAFRVLADDRVRAQYLSNLRG